MHRSTFRMCQFLNVFGFLALTEDQLTNITYIWLWAMHNTCLHPHANMSLIIKLSTANNNTKFIQVKCVCVGGVAIVTTDLIGQWNHSHKAEMDKGRVAKAIQNSEPIHKPAVLVWESKQFRGKIMETCEQERRVNVLLSGEFIKILENDLSSCHFFCYIRLGLKFYLFIYFNLSCSFSKPNHGLSALLCQAYLLCQEELGKEHTHNKTNNHNKEETK